MQDPDIDALLVAYCPTAIVSAAEAAKGLDQRAVAAVGAEEERVRLLDGRRQRRATAAPSWSPPRCRITRRRSARCAPSCIWCATGRARTCCWRRRPRSPPRPKPMRSARTRSHRAGARRQTRMARSGGGRRASSPATAFPSCAPRPWPMPRPRPPLPPRSRAPVALKIRSRDIIHKSDVGGVALDLAGARRGRGRGQGDERARSRAICPRRGAKASSCRR